ncbi:peptide deformylase [Taibaiella sp. KBW10]|uniref:peptide deformylase n=1 Tax=Taibaiella sp. KBW10 TaxID=2153357 RepID=UPI000F5A9611|nr:peptide deformylase [Taibaiella sp. KBW10]RQO30549.1 peptide deformylase [Taibaiella sp. KBW10]
MIKRILLLCLISSFGMLTACSPALNFSKQERALIHTGTEANPFRVLTIVDPKDSQILRTPSRDLKKIKNNKDLSLLLKRMQVTMDKEEGIGIAAPQIGINRNIFLFTRIHETSKKVQVAINPKIIAHAPETVCFKRDGCLSIPDIRGNSRRYDWIEVRYYDENGILKQEKFSGHVRPENFTAVIFQHEFDHIQGVLFIDKLCE